MTEAPEAPASGDPEDAETADPVDPKDQGTEESGGRSDLAERLEREGDIAADYIEELLDIADLDGDIDMDVEGERAMVSIVGGDVEHLVGDEGWRAAKRAALTETGTSAAEAVKKSGEPVRLAPMTPFERKIVHDAVAAAGLTSESEGQEPNRYVVIYPRTVAV